MLDLICKQQETMDKMSKQLEKLEKKDSNDDDDQKSIKVVKKDSLKKKKVQIRNCSSQTTMITKSKSQSLSPMKIRFNSPVKGPFGDIYKAPKVLDTETFEEEQEKYDLIFNKSNDRLNLNQSN